MAPQKDMEETSMRITRWRSQTRKSTYYIIPTTWYSGEGKAMETNSGGKGLERGDK